MKIIGVVLVCVILSCESGIDVRVGEDSPVEEPTGGEDEPQPTEPDATDDDQQPLPDNPQQPPTPSVPRVMGESFVSRWQVSDGKQRIILPLPRGPHLYNFTVDWGDGQHSHVMTAGARSASHTYRRPGIYTIEIVGEISAWRFADFPHSKDQLIAVDDLGDVGWRDLSGAFANCRNLQTVVGGNTIAVTDMSELFSGALQVKPDVSSWETGQVRDLSGIFAGALSAEPSVGDWDTSQVNDMSRAFAGASAAQPQVQDWNYARVRDMAGMFMGVTLETEVYSEMLSQLNRTSQQTAVHFDAGNSKYQSSVARERYRLIAEYGWQIFDGGLDDNLGDTLLR